ncbi:MAG: endonuclease/exonuclease/phosphatase family protein [Candidatus Bruticola sp.]
MFLSKFNFKSFVVSLALVMGAGYCLASGTACSHSGHTEKNNFQQSSVSSETVSVSDTEPEAGEKQVLTLATWNLENFFDTVDDDYNDDVLSESEYADKLTRVSSVLQQVGADIVGVEEVENAQVISDLGRRSGYPYYVLIPGNDKVRGINVGVLSKVPVRNYVTHTQDSFIQPEGKRSAVFSRDCLEVHFKHSSNFTLLVNHFKSKRGGAATDAKRIAQSTRVKEIAHSLSSYPTAICGDLNDTPEAKTLRPLLSCTFLTDVLGHLPEAERRSFFNTRYQSALDYIIVNEKLRPAVVPNSAMVCADIPDIEKASDHRPVKVIFDFNKIR